MTKLFANPDLPQSMGNGPLGCIIPAYAALLSQQGYTEHSAQLQLRFLNDMNQWLHQQRILVVDLSEQTIHQYLQSRHQRFRPRRDDAAILHRLVQLLHAHSLLPEEVTRPPDNPHQRIENDYDRYLSKERGLSVSTRVNYWSFIQMFLSFQYGDDPACLADLNADNVIQFVQNQAGCLTPNRAAMMVTTLRSFFRYLRYRGDITKDLAACVPTIPNWQFSTLPKFLQPGQVQQVLSQCDRRTAQGRRDYAILLLLARLGLRACEIVRLAGTWGGTWGRP